MNERTIKRIRLSCVWAVLIVSVLGLGVSSVRAEASESERWERLAKVLETSPTPKTVRGTFEQVRTSLLLSEPITSEGSFISAGAVSRWSLGKPDSIEVRLDAESMRIYYAEDNVLEIYPVTEQSIPALNQRPDLERLASDFRLVGIDIDERVVSIELVAKGKMRKHLQALRLVYDANKGVLRQLVTTDPAGDTTRMTLTNIVIDEPIEEQALDLEVPDDARVERPADTK
ncbi:MAG: LolA family protein [Phycisphaeraceae bacterium]